MLERWFPPLKTGQVALYPGGRFAPITMWITVGVSAFALLVWATIMVKALLGYYG